MVKLKASDVTDLIPEGEIIHVRLQNVEAIEFTHEQKPIKKLRWMFLVDDDAWPDWKGKEVSGDTSQNFSAHPNCKAYNWNTVLTGRPAPVGEEMETDDLMGLPAKALIGHKPDKQGRMWMRVNDIFPSRSSQPSPEENPF